MTLMLSSRPMILGFLMTSQVMAGEIPSLDNTTWKGPFIGHGDGVQTQETRQFLPNHKLIDTVKIIINHPLGHLAEKYEFDITYKIGREIQNLSNVYEFDATIDALKKVGLDQITIDQMNEKSECGFSDWEIGVAKDITGLKCDNNDTTNAGDQSFDLIQVTNDEMRVGADNPNDDQSGKTPEHRPTALDSKIKLVKQP